ncbi:hypothetical protein HDU93_007494 [Gonapodya sp. JEL0774]|nr:hypothetical protein HDU93_007494 [Gonapodya sp. JEL0774]
MDTRLVKQYVARQNYRPTNPDELTVSIGEHVEAFEGINAGSGLVVGTNLTTQKVGLISLARLADLLPRHAGGCTIIAMYRSAVRVGTAENDGSGLWRGRDEMGLDEQGGKDCRLEEDSKYRIN